MYSPGAVLNKDGTGVTPAAKIMHDNVLGTLDPNWKRTEINRKFAVFADNCLTMYMPDPNDTSPMAHTATEELWFENATWLNVETRDMAKDERPRTDRCKWMYEDQKFGNTGSLQDMVLKDDDHYTWPAHFTNLAGKTLVITGRGAACTFNLRDLLVKLDSFMETTLSRRRDLASLIRISISIDEVMTDSELRAEDNKIYKRLPKHPGSDFMMSLIGRLQKIQLHTGGKAMIVSLNIHPHRPIGTLTMPTGSRNSVMFA